MSEQPPPRDSRVGSALAVLAERLRAAGVPEAVLAAAVLAARKWHTDRLFEEYDRWESVLGKSSPELKALSAVAYISPPTEWTEAEYDEAVRRGRELSDKHGWDERPGGGVAV